MLHIAKLQRGSAMRLVMLRLVVQLQCLLKWEEGQDLVEYALVMALVAFGSASGMKVLASAINNEFTTISSVLYRAMS